MTPQPGDVLMLRGMPFPIASRLITRFTDSDIDHVAICLEEAAGNSLAIYEAQPPVARFMSVPAYAEQVRSWAAEKSRWRERVDKQLRCDVWRAPIPVDGAALTRMETEAERWMGVKYSMVLNYGAAWLFNLEVERWIHCSEFVGRVLVAGGIVPRWQWPKLPSTATPGNVEKFIDSVLFVNKTALQWPKLPSMITPVDIERALRAAGWWSEEWKP
jgi:hypothetical protein